MRTCLFPRDIITYKPYTSYSNTFHIPEAYFTYSSSSILFAWFPNLLCYRIVDLNSGHNPRGFMRLVDLFWNVNIFTKFQDPLRFLLCLRMAMRGSRIRDSGDHRDGFIVRLENGGFAWNNLSRKCGRKGLLRICSLDRYLQNKSNMFKIFQGEVLFIPFR